jgi:hypothetical protein
LASDGNMKHALLETYLQAPAWHLDADPEEINILQDIAAQRRVLILLGDEYPESEEVRAKREEKVWKRKATSQKGPELESKWEVVVSAGEASRLGNPPATTNGSPRPPVSQTRLAIDISDHGVLKFYATQADNSCSSMRMMKESTLSRFLEALEFFLTDSNPLLPNSTALVKAILTGQLLLELKIEHELPRYGRTDIDSLRHFSELSTPP